MCSPMCIFAYNYDAQQNILIIGCSLFQNAMLFCSILASEFNNVHDAKKSNIFQDIKFLFSYNNCYKAENKMLLHCTILYVVESITDFYRDTFFVKLQNQIAGASILLMSIYVIGLASKYVKHLFICSIKLCCFSYKTYQLK